MSDFVTADEGKLFYEAPLNFNGPDPLKVAEDEGDFEIDFKAIEDVVEEIEFEDVEEIDEPQLSPEMKDAVVLALSMKAAAFICKFAKLPVPPESDIKEIIDDVKMVWAFYPDVKIPMSPKTMAWTNLAGTVQRVGEDMIDAKRAEGATDVTPPNDESGLQFPEGG